LLPNPYPLIIPPIILPFSTVWSEILPASLNKPPNAEEKEPFLRKSQTIASGKILAANSTNKFGTFNPHYSFDC
jgi:hypothetical protein